MTQELIFNQAICILVLWLGLKYFYPDQWWAWWVALLNGVFAGWGIELWDPFIKAFGTLFENEHYQSLIIIFLIYTALLITIVVPTLAVISMMRRLLH